MNTLIVYGTKHGCTEKCARLLAKRLKGKVDLCNLKESAPDLSKYERVIIGSPVYMGSIRREVKEFTARNLKELQKKKIGLFICCMRGGDLALSQLSAAFPPELFGAAVAKDCFGGEFVFKKMNLLERFIVKKVSNIEKDTSFIQEERIDRFARCMDA